MKITRNRFLPAVFCASIASLLALGTASATHADADTPWATIQIQNNFKATLANATNYFGQSLTDDQIWLFLFADPGYLKYKDVTTNVFTPFIALDWVQLSQIQDGIIYASEGSGGGKLYAVISATQPLNPPVPSPSSCDPSCTDLAYALMEWDFHVALNENLDISNIDQFSFTNRMTVKNTSNTPVARTGFNGNTSSQAILEDLKTKYGGTGICEYPGGANFPANYPLSPPGCILPSGCDLPLYTCNGVPQNYITVPSGKMSQKIGVVTGIAAVDAANAYRWVGSSLSQNSTIPGTYVNVLQGFGKSYEPYLTALFNSPQNAFGYYVDYAGGWSIDPTVTAKGFSYIFKVTQGASGGHGFEISQIRLNTMQSGGTDSDAMVNRTKGQAFAGTMTSLANGEPILNKAPNGCAIVPAFSQHSNCPNQQGCCVPNSPNNPAFNNYGLWTDAVLTTGADVGGCNGVFGTGSIITASADFVDPYGHTQGLFAVITGQISAVLNFGLITTNWNPTDGDPGTNFIFADVTQQNYNSLLFQAGLGNADIWTKTLWQYQDFSLVPNSNPPVYSAPLYLNTYADRFKGQMSPGLAIQSGDKILWELGVPTGISSTACPADFQHSGFVDGADLSILLAQWGPCSGTCVADLNHDSAVNGADVAMMLAAWGPCAH